jgi:hypothetical protein
MLDELKNASTIWHWEISGDIATMVDHEVPLPQRVDAYVLWLTTLFAPLSS